MARENNLEDKLKNIPEQNDRIEYYKKEVKSSSIMMCVWGAWFGGSLKLMVEQDNLKAGLVALGCAAVSGVLAYFQYTRMRTGIDYCGDEARYYRKNLSKLLEEKEKNLQEDTLNDPYGKYY